MKLPNISMNPKTMMKQGNLAIKMVKLAKRNGTLDKEQADQLIKMLETKKEEAKKVQDGSR